VGPAVCEIQVEDDQDKIPRPGFTIRDDQKWITKSLEDTLIDLIQED